MSGLMHMLGGITEGVDGYVTVRCDCGWAEGPFPDCDTAVDSLMDHAYEQGFNDGQTSLKELT